MENAGRKHDCITLLQSNTLYCQQKELEHKGKSMICVLAKGMPQTETTSNA